MTEKKGRRVMVNHPEPVETRHLHGTTLHDHPGGNIPHDHPSKSSGTRTFLIVLVAGLLLACGFIRIAENEAAKNSPPGACQLMGGSWNFWDGWRCG